MNLSSVALRAPDPLWYKAPKRLNTAAPASGGCTSFGPFLSLWSGLVRVESIHPDQKTRAMTGLVRVVRVVRAKSYIIHMRARARMFFSFFCTSLLFLSLKFEFVRNTPDHPDQPNHSAASHPDRPPGPTRTTRTTPIAARLSGFSIFLGGGDKPKSRPKWSDRSQIQLGFDLVSGGN